MDTYDWYFIVVLICTFLKHLLWIYCPLVNLLLDNIFKSFSPLFLNYLTLYYGVVKVLQMLDASLLSDIYFTNIFSQSSVCLFIFLEVSFFDRRTFHLMKSNLSKKFDG